MRRAWLLTALSVPVLLALLAAVFVARVDVASQVVAAVQGATGLDAVVGSASFRLDPTAHVALKSVRLTGKGLEIASVGEADVGLAFWPLLRRRVVVTRLDARGVALALERDREGRLSFAGAPQSDRARPAMSLDHVSLTKTSFRYVNRQSDSELAARDCTVDLDDVRLAEGSGADFMQRLSLSGHSVCAEAHDDRFSGTDVRSTIVGEHGIARIAPLTMRIMGGDGSGSVDVDMTGRIPSYRVHYAVSRMQVDGLARSLAAEKMRGEGMLEFAAQLTMRGRNSMELRRTAGGEVTLRGTNLEMSIGDLDEKLSHYEASQNFNLVDLGAFLIAGPVGAAATKGRDFARVIEGNQGTTHIGVLMSQWKVEGGVAHAQDAAMATKENRLAMQGSLDFVNRRYEDVIVAKVDSHGCATVTQRIGGAFNKPDIERPNVLVALSGPVHSLITKAAKALGAKCDVFYAGSVQPPTSP